MPRLFIKVSSCCQCFLIALCLSICLAVSSAAALQAKPLKVILVGDSTTAQRTGWGGEFCQSHVVETVSCLPMGRGGRSTKTYRSDGSWKLVRSELAVTGYSMRIVLVEFGHNDKNANAAVGTSLTTGFPQNLARYIAEIRSVGAIPILVTPLASRHFVHNRLNDTLAPWALVVRRVASEQNVPVLDLNRESALLFQRLGPVGCLQFENRLPSADELRAARHGTTLEARRSDLEASKGVTPNTADYIHLNRQGAEAVARLLAALLRQALPSLQNAVVP